MLEKPKKIYFTHSKGTNIRNIFPVLMFQQLWVNKHHRLRDSKSRTQFLRHLNSGQEKFGSAYRQKKNKVNQGQIKNRARPMAAQLNTCSLVCCYTQTPLHIHLLLSTNSYSFNMVCEFQCHGVFRQSDNVIKGAS